MAKIRLTKKNYYSQEANEQYVSASWIKTALDCPARAVAEMRGEYVRPESTALLVGSFVDSFFEGTLERFVKEHPEIFKKDGSLKTDYVKAQEMIDRASADPVFMEYMRGRKQVIKTGKIAGVPFKCKMDVYRKGDRIVDLKTVKDLSPVYREGQGRISFAEAWHWPLQMAIYQRLEGNNLPCYLAVITKENPPDIEIVEIEQHQMDAEMEVLESKMMYFDAIRKGEVEPERCGKCAYCRQSKKLTGPKTLDQFVDYTFDA